MSSDKPSETSVNEVVELLIACHSFCSNMTKDDFVSEIGHETVWTAATKETLHPDFFVILSKGDSTLLFNLAKWVIKRKAELAEYLNRS